MAVAARLARLVISILSVLLAHASFAHALSGSNQAAAQSDSLQVPATYDSSVAPEGTPWLPAFAAASEFGDLDLMKDRGVVRALVTMSKTDFFVVKGRPRGLQAEYLQHYEKFLNRELSRGELRTRVVFIPVTFDQLIPALIQGKGDIACAMLTLTTERMERVDFASGRQLRADEIVVTHRDVDGIDSVSDLGGRNVYVLRGSSYAEHLRTLSRILVTQGYEPIEITEADPNLLSEDILELVNAGIVDVTVIDDYKGNLWSKVLPDIVLREDLKVHTGGRIGWAIRKGSPLLSESLNAFAQTVKKGTLLGNVLIKRYYGTTRWITNPLAERERRKLSELAKLFRKYGDRYQFDWLAVAAQAYQESGLDHSVVSPAGAVGIMQLLPSTAADPRVGISDIEDLENNVHAGVKYVSYLREEYFDGEELADEDKLALTWAAYNAGPTRIRRLRDRAEREGLDPNRWFRNVEYVALNAIGKETVDYVGNIYKYYVAYTLMSSMGAGLEDITN